jgi:hypothetical protein
LFILDLEEINQQHYTVVPTALSMRAVTFSLKWVAEKRGELHITSLHVNFTLYEPQHKMVGTYLGVVLGLKMLQLAPLNRVPFGKFNRASACPVVRRRRTG